MPTARIISNDRLMVTIAALLIVGAAFPGTVAAATSTGQFGVSLTIQAECKLQSAGALSFGSDGVLDSVISSTSALSVQCTNGTTYAVGLDAGAGSGATTSVRRMTAAGATLNYALYRDSNRTQLWGDIVATDTFGGTGNGSAQTVTVYGSVPVQSTPAAGSYADTVQVTVTY
ncbi:MAG: Spore coat protein [Acidimicrobiales bacterium]|nr:Spore coat protein [Acidimicrobiales bacterium]